MNYTLLREEKERRDDMCGINFVCKSARRFYGPRDVECKKRGVMTGDGSGTLFELELNIPIRSHCAPPRVLRLMHAHTLSPGLADSASPERISSTKQKQTPSSYHFRRLLIMQLDWMEAASRWHGKHVQGVHNYPSE